MTAQQRADRAFVLAEAAFAIFLGVAAAAGGWAYGMAAWWLFGVAAAGGFWISGERRRMVRVRAAARRDLLRDLDPGSVVLTHERGCQAVPCTCTPTIHLRAGKA